MHWNFSRYYPGGLHVRMQMSSVGLEITWTLTSEPLVQSLCRPRCEYSRQLSGGHTESEWAFPLSWSAQHNTWKFGKYLPCFLFLCCPSLAQVTERDKTYIKHKTFFSNHVTGFTLMCCEQTPCTHHAFCTLYSGTPPHQNQISPSEHTTGQSCGLNVWKSNSEQWASIYTNITSV